MAAGPPLTAEQPGEGSPTTTTRPSAHALLIIDRSDVRLGTTVQFDRLPDATQIHDLTREAGLAHVVVSLDNWPEDLMRMSALEQVPPESDVIVVLHGYPPSRGAVDTWKLVRTRLRLIVYVTGPPVNTLALDWLNESAALERVIAEMDEPSRAGFERLQRPLGFRRVVP
jgi:hypothetical protein